MGDKCVLAQSFGLVGNASPPVSLPIFISAHFPKNVFGSPLFFYPTFLLVFAPIRSLTLSISPVFLIFFFPELPRGDESKSPYLSFAHSPPLLDCLLSPLLPFPPPPPSRLHPYQRPANNPLPNIPSQFPVVFLTASLLRLCLAVPLSFCTLRCNILSSGPRYLSTLCPPQSVPNVMVRLFTQGRVSDQRHSRCAAMSLTSTVFSDSNVARCSSGKSNLFSFVTFSPLRRPTSFSILLVMLYLKGNSLSDKAC